MDDVMNHHKKQNPVSFGMDKLCMVTLSFLGTILKDAIQTSILKTYQM
jgi:hypothetical protein